MGKLWTEQSVNKPSVPAAVYVLGASIFAVGTSEFVIAGLLPELSAEFAVSIPRAGLLISAFAITMVVAAPASAIATLRMPRRATLLGALGVFILGHVLGALATSYAVLLAARIVTAATTGAFWAVAGVVTVGLVEPGIRARALATLLGGLTVANVLGVPLGTLLGQQWGWRATFWAIAALAAVAAVGVLSSLPRAGRADAAPRTVRSEVRAFTSGRLWLALATTALFQAGAIAAFSYLAPLTTEVVGLPAAAVPAVLTGYGIGSVVGVGLGGRIADAHPWHTLYGALGAVVLSLAVLAVAGSVPWLAVAAVGVLGVASFTAAAPLNTRVFALAEAAPTLASATNASAFNVGNTAGPWLGGVAISAGLGWTGPAAVGTLLAAAALGLGVASRSLDGRRPHDQPELAASVPPGRRSTR